MPILGRIVKTTGRDNTILLVKRRNRETAKLNKSLSFCSLPLMATRLRRGEQNLKGFCFSAVPFAR